MRRPAGTGSPSSVTGGAHALWYQAIYGHLIAGCLPDDVYNWRANHHIGRLYKGFIVLRPGHAAGTLLQIPLSFKGRGTCS